MRSGARLPWRAWALQGIMLAVALVLGARLVQIQVFRHKELRAQADRQWKRPEELASARGNLYDRQGRPLALSVTTWRVGVAAGHAARAAELSRLLASPLKTPRRELSRRIRQAERNHVVLAQDAILSPAQLCSLGSEPAITLEERFTREYPLGGVGASLLGFHRADGQEGVVATGLERSLAGHLDGRPGVAWRLETALPGRSLGQIVLRAPRHGHNLVLSIDADLQALCEDQLARAVQRYAARSGSVLIADPATGDILAAASWPLLADRDRPGEDHAVWNNSNFTTLYEPGSVFKLFTAASLLAHGAIDTATVYDCTDGDFGSFRIHNSESEAYGPLSFLPAFVRSINVYFARAVGNLDDVEFYRDLLEFGFGQRTSLPYDAQPAGLLRDPTQWSGRTKSTLAIGQEIAVTPLQVVMAACAVANGGILYAPRLVLEVRSHDEQLIETCPPVPLHRVLSEPLSRLLRLAMRRVVTEGTGHGADLTWISLGGKTGTAQKCAGGQGYLPGKYVASFVGLVPSDAPRLVILTVLDEPPYPYHYAAESAVPLFASVVGEIRRTTSWLTDVGGEGGARVISRGSSPRVVVPDVLYLAASKAEEEIHRAGLNMSGGGKEGRVVTQVPAGGAVCRPGETVRITVAAQPDAAVRSAALCPDLRGLSNRAVLSLAASLGVPVSVSGAGYVVAQKPAAGTPLGAEGIRVRMVASWR
jgi:stage V sporulation protein D (sporulation-specific penicillin-binding protein)